MNEDQIKLVYKMIGFLLRAPNYTVIDKMRKIDQALENIDNCHIVEHIRNYIVIVEDMISDGRINPHFNFYDRTTIPNTCITKSHSKAHQEEFRLQSKHIYTRLEFDYKDQELFHYLPEILEFFSSTSRERRQEILNRKGELFKGLREKLLKAHSFYTLLLDALMITMEDDQVYRVA